MPETLLEAIKSAYMPDIQQEAERLKDEFHNLTYDRTNPVQWVGKVKGILSKLAVRGAAPADRVVRNTVLRALEQVPEYKIRVEVIRHTSPNIALVDLLTAIS